MRCLITGINGFVGTHLAAHLCAQQHKVLGLSRSAQWKAALTVYPVLGSLGVLQWDIREAPSAELEQRIQSFEPDALVHLAAISIPADCGSESPTPIAQATNVDGTRRVLELASRLPSLRTVLLASSCHVYGPRPAEAITESTLCAPNNGYGMTKLGAEELLSNHCQANNWSGIIARGFQQTGPLQPPRLLLPEWAQQFAQHDDPVHVRSLDTTLDIMDIRDSVSDYRLLLERALNGDQPESDCLIVNVGSGMARTGTEILDALVESAGYRPVVNQTSPARRDNPIADVSYLDSLIPKRERIPFRETVSDTLAYWQSRTQKT